MKHNKIMIERDKKVALVAHDNKKADLVEWAKFNRVLLSHHTIYATGTTGTLLEKELGFPIHKLESGPLGGDQQIGAKIVDGDIDFLIFFWDPLEPMSHDPDIKALMRMAVVWNIPIACNRATADFMISSPLMDEEYDRLLPEYDAYRKRAALENDSIVFLNGRTEPREGVPMTKDGNRHRDILKRIAHRAMLERDLLPDFSAGVLAQLERINTPASMDNALPRDLRSLPWCSIDNDDSLDLDQLTVAEAMPGGWVKVLVAVADVDALVKEGQPSMGMPATIPPRSILPPKCSR